MKYLLAGLATLASVGSASAADLSYRGPRPPVAAPIYSPFYNWTGFYVGINGGGGFGGSTWDGVGCGILASIRIVPMKDFLAYRRILPGMKRSAVTVGRTPSFFSMAVPVSVALFV